MTARPPRLALNSEAARLARDLKIFLQRGSARSLGKARSRARQSSIDRILAPVADFAVSRLGRELRSMKARVTKTVWKDLRQNISERLAFALGPTLRFHEILAKKVSRALKLVGSHRNDSDNTLLESLAEFPDLLDTAARLISSWIAAQLELFPRFFGDKRNLSTFFFSKRPLRLVRIRAGLSDPHDGGRTVTKIEFGGGLRLIYKPRRCDGELFWFEALRWLERNGINVGFRIPKILARKKYFWMECLRRGDCKTSIQVRRYYFRWGAQTAVAQILGASDLHRENWLAVGSQPVLVDAESICNANEQLLPALLETGLLPLTSGDQAGFYRGIAPLDAALFKSPKLNCWPRLNGNRQPPWKYLNDLVRGFQAVADVFARPDSAQKFFREIIVRAGRNIRARIFCRSTSAYARVLRDSLEPGKMISYGQRWRWLAHQCCISSLNREVGLAEARALSHCDLPRFLAGRRTCLLSRKRFATAAEKLAESSALFRRRILSGAGMRRGATAN